MDRFRKIARNHVPEILFVFASILAAAALIYAGRGLTFFYDEWQLLLDRGSLGHALLESHNGQIFLVPTAVYRLFIGIFGIASQLPYRMFAVVMASICAVLLFAMIRRSVGGWPALAMVAPVLVLGSGWETLLLPLSINFLICLVAGLGALLLLERSDRSGDAGASLLLLVAVAAGGLGLAFVAGALVSILLRADFRRLWVVGLPIVLVLAWMLHQGGEGLQSVTMANVRGLPGYMFGAASAVVGSVSGISAAWHTTATLAKRADHALLLLVALALAVRILVVRAPISRRAVALACVLLVFWVLAGLATSVGREPEASRYQYPGAVLALATLAAMLEGMALPRLLPLVCLPVVVLSVASNLAQLGNGRSFLAGQTEISRGVLGTFEADHAGDLEGLNAGAVSGDRFLDLVTAGPYLRAVNEGGSPAFDPAQIKSSTPAARVAAARTSKAIRSIRQVLRCRVTPASGTSSPRPACPRSGRAGPRSGPGPARVNRGRAG